MKDDGVVAQPLTDAEIEQLDEFLTSEPTPKAAMDISMMDGYHCTRVRAEHDDANFNVALDLEFGRFLQHRLLIAGG